MLVIHVEKMYLLLNLNQKICVSSCFEQKYGKVLLNADRGEYYGGHKVHLAGGTWSDYESGKMYLTEELFYFFKRETKTFPKDGK